jgi:hypothetical protein
MPVIASHCPVAMDTASFGANSDEYFWNSRNERRPLTVPRMTINFFQGASRISNRREIEASPGVFELQM